MNNMGRMSDNAFGGEMFTPPTARNTDPETSHRASERVKRFSINDRRHVLIVHSHHPAGLTDFELAKLCDRQQTSVGKRRGELCWDGMIETTNERRPAPSGSPAIVWRITTRGLSIAKQLESHS